MEEAIKVQEQGGGMSTRAEYPSTRYCTSWLAETKSDRTHHYFNPRAGKITARKSLANSRWPALFG
jgi:hypothetical protein